MNIFDFEKGSGRPQIKFYKDAAPYILSGDKTLEVRPRSRAWVEKISKAKLVDLTYGPRFRPPHIFATAKIFRVEVRSFDTTTKEDLKQLGRSWLKKTPKEFAEIHKKWFAKDLAKSYPVAWIFFKLVESSRP